MSCACQNQRFRLRVAAGGSDGSVNDIAWDFSGPVTVRSKRNKRPTDGTSPAVGAPLSQRAAVYLGVL